MTAALAPIFAALVLLLLASGLGMICVRKIITIYEAKHELKQGSAGYLRSLSGWIIIALWLAVTWFCATILGDWWATGDLEGAMARGQLRLRILIEILAALADS